MIELIVVITLLGIVSITVGPRFFDTSIYDERFFYDETVTAMRYAQKLAVGSGCYIQVTIGAGGYALRRESVCGNRTYTTLVTHPGDSSVNYENASVPTAVSVTSEISPIIFTPDGSAEDSSGNAFTATATSGIAEIAMDFSSRAAADDPVIQVWAETGHAQGEI